MVFITEYPGHLPGLERYFENLEVLFQEQHPLLPELVVYLDPVQELFVTFVVLCMELSVVHLLFH